MTRRQRLQSAAVEPRAERPGALQQARAPLRRAQWSSYYHRFFGRVRPGDRVPENMQPLTLDESAQTLHDVYCGADAALQPQRQHVGRRCVSQMLIYGYRPAKEVRGQFGELVTVLADPESGKVSAARDEGLAAAARDFLLRWGVREFTPEAWTEQRRNEELKNASEKARMIARPTELMHDHGAFVVTKRVYLRSDVASMSHLINPENWELLGEFFAKTFNEQGDENSLATAKAVPWQGVLREDFICSWNGFSTNVFKQRLKVDYTVAKNIARTDYALMYEEDDQIVVNDGFFEVRHVEGKEDDGIDDGRPLALPAGWISGTMRKRLKFTSSMLNLFCPALLSMFLDSTASGFNNFVDDAAKPK